MDILTKFYVEAYKKGMYSSISIGKDLKGNHYLTNKQIGALKLLKDRTTLFCGYGGSARCFVPETYVKTIDGYKYIRDIRSGDYVLSYNRLLNEFGYKRVIKKYTFVLCSPTKMIKFENNLISTHGHRYLFRGRWTKAKELKRRAMGKSRGQLFCFFRRKVGNIKSQKFRQNRQSCGEFGMDDTQRKLSSRNGWWSAWEFVDKRRATASELFKTWFGQWNVFIDGEKHIRNKKEICSKKVHTKNVSRGIWGVSNNNKGCDSKKDLVAREITKDEILASKDIYYKGTVYDLEVEDTHSYCVTKDNIVVHNSGKTLLECFWIVFECLSYDGVGYALARKELSVLRKTVLLTLFNLLSYYNLVDGVDYKYYEQKNKLVFSNGSEIFLIDMAYQPSDPLYTRFGGLELTSAAVDESNESDINAIGTLFTRCGWRKNYEYGIKKKMLETFNPDKGHVYSRYYIPYRDKIEGVSRKFIPALPSDNPHPAVQEWISDVIAEGDSSRIQRLVYGNFDYDDNPDNLVEYSAICDIFANDKVEKKGIKYISADLAMMGRDRFVGVYWHGNVGTIEIDKLKSGGKEIEKDLRGMIRKHGVYNSNVVSDADGLGNYLESYIRNIKPFRGNKRAVNAKDYDNIKSECAWKLAEMINKREIKIICNDAQEQEIKQELSVCLRRDNTDSDEQKKKLIKKPQMKKELGHSPDYFDVLLMKMVFHLTRGSGKKFAVRMS